MIPNSELSRQHSLTGFLSAWAVALLIFVYALTLIFGLLSLKSPDAPIGNPYFFILECLILLMMPFLLAIMAVVHAYAAPDKKLNALLALVMMAIATTLTSGVHFVILSVSRHQEMTAIPWMPLILSFKWPSIVYALDILAWDWFFALAMLLAAPVFKKEGREKTVRQLMIVCGVLSLAGLIGVPLENMQIRMIGVLGYVGVTPFVFWYMGQLFRSRFFH